MEKWQGMATSPLGRRVLGAALIGWLCTGCAFEPEQSGDSNSVETISETAKPLHSERLSNGAVLSFWSTGAGGPAAVELLAPKATELEARFAALAGANPIQFYEAFREGAPDPRVIELLTPMTSEWSQATIATQETSARDALDAPDVPTSNLIPKNHGTAWFTTNHCDHRGGTLVRECLHSVGPTVQTAVHQSGPFGQGTLLDPWVFSGYNDHTGTATFTTNWSGGVIATAQVPANTVVIRSVTSNGHAIWARMTNVTQMAHIAVRGRFVLIH